MLEGPPSTEVIELNKIQSSREYSPTTSVSELLSLPESERKVVEKPITPDTKVCIIGDGQGADTKLFSSIVKPENITSINYDLQEVADANERFEKEGSLLRMKQGDIRNTDSLRASGISEGTQDLVIAAHVLEVPIFNTKLGNESARQHAAQNEILFMDNIAKILKPDGEALIFSYTHQLTPEQAKNLGVEKVTQETAKLYGVEWRPDMTYAELSAIRSKEELTALFTDKFAVTIDETTDGYAVKLQKKTS